MGHLAEYKTDVKQAGPSCSMKFRHEGGRVTGDTVMAPGPGQYSATTCNRPRSAAFSFGCSRPQAGSDALRWQLPCNSSKQCDASAVPVVQQSLLTPQRLADQASFMVLSACAVHFIMQMVLILMALLHTCPEPHADGVTVQPASCLR